MEDKLIKYRRICRGCNREGCDNCGGVGELNLIVKEVKEWKPCIPCDGTGLITNGGSKNYSILDHCPICKGEGKIETGRVAHRFVKFEQINLEEEKKLNGGMTQEEREIADHIVEAVNKFEKLKRTHPDEWNDFVNAIHQVQSVLGMRVLRRDYPDYWLDKGEKQ